MAQGAINHICKNITKSLEAAKERKEEQLHHFAFCKEWLSPCFCRSVFAFPRVCLYFWKQQEHIWGKENTAWCLHSKLSLYFGSYCGTFQDRSSVGNGNQTNLQHLKCSHFCSILGQFPDKLLQFSKGIILDNYCKEANDFSKPDRFQCPSDLPELRHQKDDTSCCPAAATGKDSL